MAVRRHSRAYNFVGEPATGLTVRWGTDLETDPHRAPWPELVDISVSNRCTKGCAFCYRDSRPDGELMSLEAYEYVLEQLTSPLWGAPFQVALGGGEPLEHPQFLGILEATAVRGIVANFTTNGLHLDSTWAKLLPGRAGAVALSVPRISELDPSRPRMLRDAGVRTNLHFILDRDSLPEAIEIARGLHDRFLSDLSGIVFLTRKPKGRASPQGCLEFGDPLLDRFLELVANPRTRIPLGFDACAVPLLLQSGCADPRTVDACECGFFSAYIDEKLDVKPCSFDMGDAWTSNLFEEDFATIWEERWEPYRLAQSAQVCARECGNKAHCRGTCPHFPGLSFCHTEETP